MVYNIALISGYVQIKNLTADTEQEALTLARTFLGAWAFITWDFAQMCKINRVIVMEGHATIAEYKTVGAPVKMVAFQPVEVQEDKEASSMGAFPEDSKFWYPR